MSFAFYPMMALKIGLLVVATGRYIEFIPNLVEQGKKYFLPNHEITYFVFADRPLAPQENIVLCYQKKLDWPYSTMLRYETYLRYKHLYAEYDYLFACDADMDFIGIIDETILGKSVGILHPGFAHPKIDAIKNKQHSPLIYHEHLWNLLRHNYSHETSPASTAYLPNGKFYFCGGVFGGEKDTFLHILETLTKNIRTDMANNIIAVWHDESHLNRYFNTHLPEKILTPFYCFPDTYTYHLDVQEIVSPKIIALTKDHNAYRG